MFWWQAPPLGHDEARYAVDARELLEGRGKRYLYAPIGMDVMAAPGIALGGGERAMRGSALVAGLLFVLAVWRFAARCVDRETACWSVGVVAATLPIVRHGAELLSDLPSAACLLAGLSVLVPELAREQGPTKRVVATAPWFAAAFYLRYGSCASIAIIAIVACCLFGRAIVRRPRPVAATIAVFALLLVPHVVHAITVTGLPTGILVASGNMPGRPCEGLVTYLMGNPFALYGVAAPLMLVGLLGCTRTRAVLALQVIAIAQVVVLGLTTHAQSRYVVLAIVILSVLGVATVRRWIGAVRGKAKSALVLACIAALAGAWIVTVRRRLEYPAHRTSTTANLTLAAAAIRNDAGHDPCDVVGDDTTLLAWYSPCRVVLRVRDNAARVYIVRYAREPRVEQCCVIFSLPGVVEVLRLRR
jgi:hypothetical protein